VGSTSPISPRRLTERVVAAPPACDLAASAIAPSPSTEDLRGNYTSGDPTTLAHVPITGSRLCVTLASKLRVTGTETEHMPLYLRTFFRVLSSWVHA